MLNSFRMELGSATFACSRTEESNSSSTLSSFSASPAHHEQMITLMPSTKITIGPLSEESNSSSPLSICSASPAHHEQLITLMPSTKVFNKDSVERINNVIKAEDGITPSTQSTSSCMAQSPYPKCSPLNWFPRKRTESYLERKIRMLQEKEGTNATLDETLGDSNLHLPRIEREKLAAQTAARVAMEAHKAALVEASWCRILKAARIQCTLAEVQLKKAEQKAAEAFDSAAAVRVIIDNNPGGSKQSLEIETSTTDGRSTHTVSASLETVFEVEKEVAEAVKVAFFRLAHLPSSSIKDIFNANDDACKRVSINLDENAVKFNNDSDSKDFSSEACSESEAQTGGEHQTDSELERDADATAPETNCIQIRKNVAKALVQKHRHHLKHHHSNRQPPKEIIVSEELIDLMLGRVKLLKEEELVSLAMIVATRGLSAMLKEDNKEQELNGKCSSGGLGDILVKHVSRLEAEKSAAAAAASKVVVVPRDNRRELTSEILPDLGSILVKHVSKFESEVQEAKRLAKAIKSEDNRNLGELKEHGESLFEDSTKDNSFETNPELRRSFVKHAELMIHVSEKTTKLAESEQQNAGSLDANLLEKIHVSEREQFTATGEKCAKMLQPKSGLSKKQSMETDVNLADDIDTEYDKENRDINIYSTENKTLEMKSKFDILNNNSLDKMKKSNFNSTASGSDLSTIPLKHVTELEQGILAAKSALDVVERVQRKQNHHNGNSEEGLDKILVKHVSKLEKEKLAAAALSNEASGSMQEKKQLRCVKREESLDKDLVKHISKLEKEKLAAAVFSNEASTTGVQRRKQHHYVKDEESLDKVLVKHISKLEKEKMAASALTTNLLQNVDRKHQLHDTVEESLDKVLVKHISKLEKERLAALASEKESFQRVQRSQNCCDRKDGESLENILIKHISKLEREKIAASELTSNSLQNVDRKYQLHDTVEESLDKVLVKHISKLEKEKLAALASEKESFQRVQRSPNHCDSKDGESLENVLVKHISKLEKAKMEAVQEASERVQKSQRECDGKNEDSLDKVLVKHVSRLEREKNMAAAQETFQRVQRNQRQSDEGSIESLDKILVKHLSQLEKEKQRASTKGSDVLPQSSMSQTRDQVVQLSHTDPFGPMVGEMSRIDIEKQETTIANVAGDSVLQRHRNARAHEIQEAWGGFSLGNSLRRHMSQLEIEKAAWHRAEEEARMRASQY